MQVLEAKIHEKVWFVTIAVDDTTPYHDGRRAGIVGIGVLKASGLRDMTFTIRKLGPLSRNIRLWAGALIALQ